jgi:hypothetical protein
MSRGWNDKVGAFTQYHGTDVLDSSLLLMPVEGFISPTDPRWLSTLKAMDDKLVSDSLVYRYNPARVTRRAARRRRHLLTVYVPVRQRACRGRPTRRRVLTFEKMFTYGNHVGLFSEEIDSTGGLAVEPGAPKAKVLARVPVQAVVDGDGYDGGLLLYVDEGSLSALEYWWVTEDPAAVMPPPSAIGSPIA